MSSVLEQLKAASVVVADTGDFNAIKEFQPTDATTNPSLILAASKMEQYASLIDEAVSYAKTHASGHQQIVEAAMDRLFVVFGKEILKTIPGRVSTEVDARLSFDTQASINRALGLIAQYEKEAKFEKKQMTRKIRMMDGSMSSQLNLFGYKTEEHSPHWTFPANKNEQLMQNVYMSFLDMGCEIITTNTYHFGSVLDKNIKDNSSKKFDFELLFKKTCDLLCNLVESKKSTVEVWGSVGTLATMYHDMSEYNGKYIDSPDSSATALQYFCKLINMFYNRTSIRNLIFETISSEKEALAALESLKKIPCMKAVMSFSCKENGILRHGENIEDIAKQLVKEDQIVGIGINCTDPININSALLKIKQFKFQNVFVYPNIGDANFLNDKQANDSAFDEELVFSWMTNGATVIGGCCGVTDFQMKQLKHTVDQINKRYV